MESGSILQGVNVLLVEDDDMQRNLLRIYFFNQGASIEEASNGVEALEVLAKGGINVVLTDICMPRCNGIDMLRSIREDHPEIPVVVYSGYGNPDTRKEAIRAGAFAYHDKPAALDALVADLAKAYEHHLSLSAQINATATLKHRDVYSYLIGDSPKMLSNFEYLEKVADTDETVLLLGETGTGKELFARAIHDLSAKRSKHEFVPINCGCVPEELLESELFGHKKGAFTGANANKLGKFEIADNGTVFLDEIGDMQSKLQVKLLRVLQERKIEPVGAPKEHAVNIRVVAATHQALDQLIRDKRFREDLYYRLAVCVIRIPSLRERREDIPLLADHFIKKFNELKGINIEGVTDECMQFLMDYSWPGNIRQFENTFRHLSIVRTSGLCTVEDARSAPVIRDESAMRGPSVSATPQISVPNVSIGDSGAIDFASVIRDVENRLLDEAMAITGHNKREAAKLLGLKRTTLIEKLKKRGITAPAMAVTQNRVGRPRNDRSTGSDRPTI